MLSKRILPIPRILPVRVVFRVESLYLHDVPFVLVAGIAERDLKRQIGKIETSVQFLGRCLGSALLRGAVYVWGGSVELLLQFAFMSNLLFVVFLLWKQKGGVWAQVQRVRWSLKKHMCRTLKMFYGYSKTKWIFYDQSYWNTFSFLLFTITLHIIQSPSVFNIIHSSIPYTT